MTLVLMALEFTCWTWSFAWYRTAFYKGFGVEVEQGPPHGAPGGQGASGAQGNATAQMSGMRPSGENQERGERGNREGRGEGMERGERGNPEGRGEGRGEFGNREGRGGRSQGGTFAKWQQVYNEVNSLNPHNKSITISNGTANVTQDGWGNQRASDRYSFDASTGEITSTSLYADGEKAGKIRGWIYTVHVGSRVGMISIIITCVASLFGAALAIPGFYLWIKRTNARRRSKSKRVQ